MPKEKRAKIPNVTKTTKPPKTTKTVTILKIFKPKVVKPPKTPFNTKFCHRCGRRGHISAKCTREDTVKGLLIKGDISKRVGAGGRRVREINVFSSKYFGDAVFQELDIIQIQGLQSCVPGIYEIGIKKKVESRVEVAYLGMSNDLRERLKDHMLGDRIVDGRRRISNIARETADCRAKKFIVCFRFRVCTDEMVAKALESELLEEFDYAWNLEENGKNKRFIL